jgi:hypothetical protein
MVARTSLSLAALWVLPLAFPPRSPATGGLPTEQQVPLPRIERLSVSGLPIILESTPIGRVVRHFRKGRVVDVRGGTEGDVQLCYALRDSASYVLLILYSEDMGGPQQAVMGFALERRSSRPAGCASLEIPLSAVVIDRGIRLDMSLDEVRQNLGSGATGADSTTLRYSDSVLYQPHRPASAGRPEIYAAWTYFSVTAQFAGGALVRLEAWKVTST